MSFAVLQQELNPPDVEAVRRALGVIDRLTDYDAWGIARDAFGVLVERLTYDEASRLQAALEGEGIATVVVSDEELFPLPGAKRTRQVDPGPDTLVIYDPLDRPNPVPWENVVLVAVGEVTQTKSRMSTSTRPPWTQAGGVYSGGGMYVGAFTETTITEQSISDTRLEILLDVEPMRINLEPFGTRYTSLGPRLTQRAKDNFAMLARDIIEAADGAVLNQGAEMLLQTAGHTFTYPTLRAFEEEIVWQVWKVQQSQ